MDTTRPVPDFSPPNAAREYDPFPLLGAHREGSEWAACFIRTRTSTALDTDGTVVLLTRVHR